MRIIELNEAPAIAPDEEERPERPTNTRTRSAQDDLLAKMFGTNMGNKQVAKPAEPKAGPQSASSSATPNPRMRTASAAQTRARAVGIQASPEIAQKFNQMDLNAPDAISDDEAMRNAGVEQGEVEPQPVEPSTMPAVISTALRAAGIQDPEWHAVKHLPGYLQSGIRAIGRAVFAPFTNTPIEDVTVVANVNDSGPNSEEEIKAVAAFLLKHGKVDMDASLEFHDRIPDYGAKVRLVRSSGVSFLIVKDFAGHYIYSWPTSDEKTGIEGKAVPDRPRLR